MGVHGPSARARGGPSVTAWETQQQKPETPGSLILGTHRPGGARTTPRAVMPILDTAILDVRAAAELGSQALKLASTCTRDAHPLSMRACRSITRPTCNQDGSAARNLARQEVVNSFKI